MLSVGNSVPPPQDDFLISILKKGLLTSAEYVFDKMKTEEKDILNLEIDGVSILFNILQEGTILNIMTELHPIQWGVMSRNGLAENLLHHFINQKFAKAIDKLFSVSHINVEQLLFQVDAAGNFPIMTILSQDMEDSAQKLWKLMIKTTDKIRECQTKEIETENLKSDKSLESILTHKNKKGVCILHICAERKQNVLMDEICNTKHIPREVIQTALTEKNPDGKSVLSLIKSQDTMTSILSHVTLSEMNLTEVENNDNKGRNIFHHLVIKDFARVIMMLKTCIPRDKFIEMILQPGFRHKNNVLMRAALGSATKSLQFLLCFISTEQLSSEEENQILHNKDDFDNNLLSLVLQQGEALQVSKQILLELEKKYHEKEKDQSWKAFIDCLKSNIDPSIEVLNAIKDVEKTLQKDFFQTSLITGKCFIQYFLMPSTIMAVDIGFDILLINEYHKCDQDCLDYQYNMCLEFSKGQNTTSNATINEKCDFPYSNFIPAYSCIPLKFANRPRYIFENNILSILTSVRFFYSLGFVVWPWIFYCIEYMQSKMFRELTKVTYQAWSTCFLKINMYHYM